MLSATICIWCGSVEKLRCLFLRQRAISYGLLDGGGNGILYCLMYGCLVQPQLCNQLVQVRAILAGCL